MSEKTVNPVSSGAARAAQPNPVPLGASGGKVGPDAGKISPQQQASIRAMNLDTLVQELNTRSRSVSPALRFEVDVSSGLSIIQVFDRDTGELIRQIPPETAGALARGQGSIDLSRIDDLV